ncbi:magnesium transporter [Desulfatiglans anilini]|uniref:magnesium transporter n=1 Tax=Desulfatiglans anilini TaxID=90728 RepID=UPI000417DC39|nr:magnesium transporter [Desulfatiglans anilini]
MATYSADIDHNLVDRVEHFIRVEDEDSLLKLIDEMRPADAADLIEHLDPEERLFIFKLLEPQDAGEVLIEMESPAQDLLLRDLDDQTISEIVQELDSDDAADLVGDLPEDRARNILEALENDVSDELAKLLPYPEDSAGGIMALEFIAVRAGFTVQDAIDSIRQRREEVENVYFIWVVDDFDRLVGVVSLKDLVLEPPDRKISDIMNTEVISVHVRTDQEEVARLVTKYDLVSIPVVDDYHRLVGRITHDDIIDVIEDEVDEDIARMAGVMPQEIAEESSLKISRARLPWLIAGVFGGILAAAVIHQFETSLERIIALSFFFPVIMAMGGNTGTQAATVVVRGLATGDITMFAIHRRLLMELRVALINGIICGALVGSIVAVWLADMQLGTVVALAACLIVLNSAFIGSAVPFALKKFNIDPALATGPFVTTSNDILGLLIYLGLVSLYLGVGPR